MATERGSALGPALAASIALATASAIVLAALQPLLVPLILLLAALGVFLLLRPGWALPAFVALTWLALDDRVFGGLPSPVEVGGALLLGVAALYACVDRVRGGEAVVITALLGLPLIAAGLVASGGPRVPIDELQELAFFFIVAMGLRDRTSLKRAAVSLAAAGAFLGAGAVFSLLITPTAIFPLSGDEFEASRAAGPFGEPNFFALSMAALVPLALYLVATGGWRQWLGVLSAVCLSAGIFATGSRGGVLALIFALVTFGFTSGGKRVRAASLVVVAVTLSLAPIFAAQAQGSAERSLEGRATENLVAIGMFGDHPILGVGPGVYESLYRDYSRNIGNDDRLVREPHSLPLEIAAEQGIGGVIGWLGAGLVLFALARAGGIWRDPLGRAAIFATLTYLVGSLFLHGSQLRLLFILAGMVFAAATLPLYDPHARRQADEEMGRAPGGGEPLGPPRPPALSGTPA